MKTQVSQLFFLLCGLLIISSCNKDKDDGNEYIVFGRVLDYLSGDSIANAEIKVLEDGPSTTSDAGGIFRFRKREIEDYLVSREGMTGSYALRFSAGNYKTLEINIPEGLDTNVELVPAEYTGYVYQLPVTLNDAISTGSLVESGLDTALINTLLYKLSHKGYREVHSMLVYYKHKLVVEEYYKGNNDTIQFENNIYRDRTPDSIQWTREDEHYLASVTKSITSSIVGIALESFGASVDDEISQYLPGYSSYFSDENKAALTIKNCLTMTLGFKWDEWGSNDLSLLWKSDDFTEFLLDRVNSGPGINWIYCSASPNVLLNCMDHLVGGNIRQWADENFFAKLGIRDYKWQSQPGGLPEGAARLYLRPRDMLKIGITYLDNGKYDGEQVIPSAWVDACSQVQYEGFAGDYSYFFWNRNLSGIDYLSADGDGGNYINIFKDLDLIVVFTQGNYLQYDIYNNQTNAMMRTYLLPAVN